MEGAGASPSDDAYLTVLRQAFAADATDQQCLYFDATSGQLFGSADSGGSWTVVASDLAPVLSVRVA